MTLPLSVFWSGTSPVYDLDDVGRRARVYEQVLREGTDDDVRRFIDVDQVIALWDLLVLPVAVRRAWARWLSERRGVTLGCSVAFQVAAPLDSVGVVEHDRGPTTETGHPPAVMTAVISPSTPDDQSRTWDGRVLNTKEAMLEFLEEIEETRRSGRRLDPHDNQP